MMSMMITTMTMTITMMINFTVTQINAPAIDRNKKTNKILRKKRRRKKKENKLTKSYAHIVNRQTKTTMKQKEFRVSLQLPI